MAECSDRSDSAQAHQLAELHYTLSVGTGRAVKPPETAVHRVAARDRVVVTVTTSAEAILALASNGRSKRWAEAAY